MTREGATADLPGSPPEPDRVIDVPGLQALLDRLVARGYTVIGPTVRSGAIVNAPIRSVEELPRGWGDEQDAGRYRLRRREDEALFGFAAGAQSAKPVFFPAEEVLWRGRRSGEGFEVAAPEAGDGADLPPYALLGVRSCDLSAIGIHDVVLTGRAHADVAYAARRSAAFVVAVTCSDPSGTCFCASTGTGPRPERGRGASYDLSLTELLGGPPGTGTHRFVVEVASDRGAELLDEIGARAAPADDVAAGDRVAADAAGWMGRHLDTDGLKELLYDAAESPLWDDVATRCLACGNCTAVCPTCFCTTVEDVTDLTGDVAGRDRVWDSCFDADHSWIHGGTVRASTKARYRQWMTHKLASWVDQFGTSGCVGCGRCVTWCPAAIDITAEAAALRLAAEPADPTSGGS
ncbi:4Fe-4S dicluster domain-containing protein [Nocardioides sp. YIM 152588]|uniref:4Fe-4S dicluster domain-containing protein n=1 Tax=Nocardioides sp. YIM 152588 TaxID=3158259 RepID=UPI0032E3A5B8